MKKITYLVFLIFFGFVSCQEEDEIFETYSKSNLKDEKVAIEDYTIVPDNNFEQALIDLGHDDVLDGNVLTATLNSLIVLTVKNKNISDLTGIEACTNLIDLNVASNQLTSLDLSNNKALTRLVARSNDLEVLNYQNGVNVNNTKFDIRFNNLGCVNVDDAEYSVANWTLVDTAVDFSEFCYSTVVPDNNFEQALIDLGHDDVLDGHVLTETLNSLIVLTVKNKNISDLTGIEECVNLIDLNCASNQLTTLDLSNNTALTRLVARSNDLEVLNYQNGVNIDNTKFDIRFNNLGCINVDDAEYSTANWSLVDASVTFSQGCSTIEI